MPRRVIVPTLTQQEAIFVEACVLIFQRRADYERSVRAALEGKGNHPDLNAQLDATKLVTSWSAVLDGMGVVKKNAFLNELKAKLEQMMAAKVTRVTGTATRSRRTKSH